MGSTGSGNFSDYPGNKNAKVGVTGGESTVNVCERAIMTGLEDVGTSDYYQKYHNVPPIGTDFTIAFSTRIVAVDENGDVIGNLPTDHNYLMRCLSDGYQYEGQVIGSANLPIPSVQIAATPQKK